MARWTTVTKREERAEIPAAVQHYPGENGTLGAPYKRIVENVDGVEVETDIILKTKTSTRMRSPVLSQQEANRIRAKGFNLETAIAVKAQWAEGLTTAQIVRASGFSPSTINKIRAEFEKLPGK